MTGRVATARPAPFPPAHLAEPWEFPPAFSPFPSRFVAPAPQVQEAERAREREGRARPEVDLTDPAQLAAWLAETRALANHLHALTLDATAPKAHGRHARTYLRAHTRRDFQTLGALLSALDPAEPAPAES